MKNNRFKLPFFMNVSNDMGVNIIDSINTYTLICSNLDKQYSLMSNHINDASVDTFCLIHVQNPNESIDNFKYFPKGYSCMEQPTFINGKIISAEVISFLSCQNCIFHTHKFAMLNQYKYKKLIQEEYITLKRIKRCTE